ncbi:Os01g0209566 [Oryza sativa Japonica Group]|uniref:Os01g0209566 protein n=1 Tax=Oryza sativa subsp. japonica TaxID=39947 RepID=A0A0P0UZQ3_ORYSJ|nr:hypothetical protein EE612_000982 [Oryza sativa]BAS70971.1 Os01g0209566 [Oryza sativa Japonica Group]
MKLHIWSLQASADEAFSLPMSLPPTILQARLAGMHFTCTSIVRGCEGKLRQVVRTASTWGMYDQPVDSSNLNQHFPWSSHCNEQVAKVVGAMCLPYQLSCLMLHFD